MSSKDTDVRELITEVAAEWFVANRDGLTAKERQAFAEWLQASPAHVEEYLAHSVIASNLRNACQYSDEALGELIARARAQADTVVPLSPSRYVYGSTRTGWRPVVIIAAACLLVGVGLIALQGLWPKPLGTPPQTTAAIHIATRHGEWQTRQLSDNSVLNVNTDSAVTVRYSDKERLVILEAGEADFVVAHDAGRPFRVIAGATQTLDVGTSFDVLLGPGATVVTVVEGRVAVSPRMSPAVPGAVLQKVRVQEGQRLTVVDGVWPPAKPVTVDALHATAWLHRQIVFDHAPLDKVAAEFNRYTAKPFEIVTPGLQKLEISGVFTTDDPAAFIAFLRSLDSVRVEETATQFRVSRNPR